MSTGVPLIIQPPLPEYRRRRSSIWPIETGALDHCPPPVTSIVVRHSSSLLKVGEVTGSSCSFTRRVTSETASSCDHLHDHAGFAGGAAEREPQRASIANFCHSADPKGSGNTSAFGCGPAYQPVVSHLPEDPTPRGERPCDETARKWDEIGRRPSIQASIASRILEPQTTGSSLNSHVSPY